MLNSINNTLILVRSQPGLIMVAPTLGFRDVGDMYTIAAKDQEDQRKGNISVGTWNTKALRPSGKL